jgi:hypothetical protein
MAFANTDRIVVPDGVVTRAIKGSTVLLHTATGRYFTLDDIGGRVWTVLTSSATIQDAHDTLRSEYDADATELDRDIDALIETLCREGLAEVRRG